MKRIPSSLEVFVLLLLVSAYFLWIGLEKKPAFGELNIQAGHIKTIEQVSIKGRGGRSARCGLAIIARENPTELIRANCFNGAEFNYQTLVGDFIEVYQSDNSHDNASNWHTKLNGIVVYSYDDRSNRHKLISYISLGLALLSFIGALGALHYKYRRKLNKPLKDGAPQSSVP